MSPFELIEPGVMHAANRLPEGWGSIGKSGKLVVHQSDLDLVGIGRQAAVLVDVDTWRVAIRALRPDERGVVVSTVTTGKHKRSSGKCYLNIRRAVLRLGLETERIAGRYELSTKGQGADALLMVCLMPDNGLPKTKGKK